jgi:iron complex outermembrane receptor protein
MRLRYAALLATTAMFTVVAPASAQEATAGQDAPTTAPAASADQDSQLDEIVVTAERRDTSLQRTPLSIVAVSAEQLESRGINNIQDFQNFVPNVSIGASVPFGSSFPNASIRGVGQATARENNDRGVALYIDDLFYPRSTGSLLRLLDVERVEVLRGPQGTLFGRNAAGGAIRYITKKPSQKFEGYVRGTYGSFDRTDLDGLINVPLTDNLAVRLQAGYSKTDGFIKEVDYTGKQTGTRGGEENSAFRGAVRWQPTDRITVDFSAAYSKVINEGPAMLNVGIEALPASTTSITAKLRDLFFKSVGQGSQTLNDPRLLSPDFKTYPHLCAVTAMFQPISGSTNVTSRDLSTLCDTGSTDKNLFGTLDIQAELTDHISLRSISGYQKLKNDSRVDNFGDGIPHRFVINTEVKSEEVQLKYDSDNLKGVVGLFYYDESLDRIDQVTTLPSAGPNAFKCCTFYDEVFTQSTRSLGLFASATYNFTQALSLTLGGRYTNDRKKGYLFNTTAGTVDGTPGFNQLTDRIPYDATFSSFDYRATLDYRVTPDIFLFGTVSTGFKAGGVGASLIAYKPFSVPRGGVRPGPAITPQIGTFDPERIQNYEAGIRSEFFNHKLRVNLTGFYMNYKDFVIQTPDFSTPPGLPQQIQDNAGDVILKGFEGEVLVAPARGLTLNASLAYTGQHYTRVDPLNGSPLLFPNQPATCSLANGKSVADTCNLLGMPRTPAWSYTLGADYRTNLGADAGSLSFNLNYAYKSSTVSSNSTSNNLTVPSYGIVNGRITYQAPSGWSLAVFGTNLLNKEYAVSGATASIQTTWGGLVLYPGRPREWGVTGTWRF